MSRYRIAAQDLAHAREFLNDPRGVASPGLQRVLNVMRSDVAHGKYVLIVKEPHRRWVLGRLSTTRGEPVETLDDFVFEDLIEAERVVFRLRWKELTGEALAL